MQFSPVIEVVSATLLYIELYIICDLNIFEIIYSFKNIIFIELLIVEYLNVILPTSQQLVKTWDIIFESRKVKVWVLFMTPILILYIVNLKLINFYLKILLNIL